MLGIFLVHPCIREQFWTVIWEGEAGYGHQHTYQVEYNSQSHATISLLEFGLNYVNILSLLFFLCNRYYCIDIVQNNLYVNMEITMMPLIGTTVSQYVKYHHNLSTWKYSILYHTLGSWRCYQLNTPCVSKNNL